MSTARKTARILRSSGTTKFMNNQVINKKKQVCDEEEEKEEDITIKSPVKKMRKTRTTVIKNLDKSVVKETSPYFNNIATGDIEEGGVIWMPRRWQEMLQQIELMRKAQLAPVDTMGCHKCADTNSSPTEQRYQTLLALMLSSQTKDQVTYAAMERLKNSTPNNNITIEEILKKSQDELAKILHPVGFYKTKAKHILQTSKMLKEKFNGDIPDSVEGLCSLPGVGPKMAHICMLTAWNKVSGIGVDTHVHRIAQRLGWCRKKTKTPEDTRLALESWLPREYWPTINELLVGFGQTICLPVKPHCDQCAICTICPSSNTSKAKLGVIA